MGAKFGGMHCSTLPKYQRGCLPLSTCRSFALFHYSLLLSVLGHAIIDSCYWISSHTQVSGITSPRVIDRGWTDVINGPRSQRTHRWRCVCVDEWLSHGEQVSAGSAAVVGGDTLAGGGGI